MAVTLKAEARHDKYLVVVVHNADGTFRREYRLTPAEQAQFRTKGQIGPPGLVNDELDLWKTQRVVVVGRAFDIGDAKLNADGSVTTCVGEVTTGGRAVPTVVTVDPGDWTGTFPAITCTQVRTGRSAIKVAFAIVNGVTP